MARKRDSSRDRAGTGPDPERGVRLVPIDRLKDFRIAEGEPDVRGWEVRTLSGRQLGDVKNLLVDPEAGEVVMLDIDLANEDRHTLAPIRAAQLDRERRCVIIDSSELDRGGAPPSYRRGQRVSEEDARAFDQGYQRAYGDPDRDRNDRYTLRSDEDDEVIIERRPTEYEEVVVRRKRADPDARDREDQPPND